MAVRWCIVESIVSSSARIGALLAGLVLAAGCGDDSAATDGGTDAYEVPVDAPIVVVPDGGGPGTGSWDDPIVIDALPFSHAGDTRGAPADDADAYSPCAPDTDESGGEYVYRLTLASATTLVISVDDVAGDDVDIDVHLLSAADPATCVARDNVSIHQQVDAGTYYIVADTWVDGSAVEMSGRYLLTVTADGGGGDCLTCPIECTADDMPLVNGVPTEPAGLGGCPAGMAAVDTFCVDRWEAMLVEVKGDDSLAPFSPYANPGTTRVRAMSAPDVVPQGYVDQLQAGAACAEAGKRLCTDDEWLRACQGSPATTYPYGDAVEPGVCNDARDCHPVVQYFETTADWIWSELGNPCINQLPDGLAATGSHPGCESADGMFDMMGNLHEWTADPNGTFRGGFYVDTVINGSGCLYRTTAHNVYHWDYSTGFRCCADR